MLKPLSIKSTNIILYCRHWTETVAFYRDGLGWPILFASEWFVEFQITETSRLSVANEQRATLKSNQGAGITLTLQVEDSEAVWHLLQDRGLTVGPLKNHAWGARVFYFYDPEGHRLEIWSPLKGFDSQNE
jgi:catechol 2,3-dioxygenase-like lactoylglutathione lyase family enzyme